MEQPHTTESSTKDIPSVADMVFITASTQALLQWALVAIESGYVEPCLKCAEQLTAYMLHAPIHVRGAPSPNLTSLNQALHSSVESLLHAQ